MKDIVGCLRDVCLPLPYFSFVQNELGFKGLNVFSGLLVFANSLGSKFDQYCLQYIEYR